MQITVNKKSNGKVEIDAKTDANEVVKAKKKALEKLGQHVTVPGFRKGKAPLNIVEKSLKPEKLLEEVLSFLSEDVYVKALDEHEIAPITRPAITIPALEDVKTQEEATNTLWPSITETGVEIKITTFVMPEIRLGDWRKIVKSVKEGDDSKSKKGKKRDEDKAAETIEKTPEQKQRELEDRIIDALVEGVKFDVAEELIEGETDQMVYKQVETVQRLGINYEDFLKAQNKTWQEVRDEFKKEAEKVVRARFVISEIAKDLEGELGEDPKIQDVIDYFNKIRQEENAGDKKQPKPAKPKSGNKPKKKKQ